MSILVDRSTRVVIQGITGRRGRSMAKDMRSYGTQVVAGVSPGHGGEIVEGVPVFDFVDDAVRSTGANTALVLVPGLPGGLAAITETALSGVELAVWLADPVPIHDMIRLMALLPRTGMRLVGPNSPGLMSPGRAKVGFMPTQCYAPGPVGVVSKSGSLSYEVSLRLTRRGLGQSTVVGIGGDPVKGTGLADVVRMFEADPDTRLILVLGEVGGTEEYELARLVASGEIRKPVVALIVGATAPTGKKLGHAGAMMFRGREGFLPKVRALEVAGVRVADSLTTVADVVAEHLGPAPAGEARR
ncbi:MAG TPA: succinate--CoA ligase subunit alpha [Thermodesulfobacteriota bacterium]